MTIPSHTNLDVKGKPPTLQGSTVYNSQDLVSDLGTAFTYG